MVEIKRIKLYVNGLDEEIEGGIPEGFVTLLAGTAGSMKSSLAFNMMYNEVLMGKKGIYISLEQSIDSLLQHMNNLGFDTSKINMITLDDLSKVGEKVVEIKAASTGALIMTDLGAIRKQVKSMDAGPTGDWLNVIKNLLTKLKEADLHICVLDSLAALYALTDFKNPRSDLFWVFEFFRNLKLTTFLISEVPLDKSKYGEYGVEDFLADGVISVELAPRMRKVDRNISIVKMRSTNCNNDIFTLQFKEGKFHALYGGRTPLV